MGKRNGKSVTISIGAIDRVSSVVRSINQKMAGITSPITRANNSFRRLGEEVRKNPLWTGFSAVKSDISDVVSEAGKLGLKLGGLAGAGGFAAFELLKNFGEASNHIADSADKLGLTTRRYQELAGGAKVAGVEEEALNSSLEKFSRNIAEAAAGSAEAEMGFYALGINVVDAHGKLRGMDSLLPQVADRLARIHDAELRNAVGARVFGKGFGQIIPFLKDGSKGIDAFVAQFVRLGGVISDDGIAGGDGFSKALGRVQIALTGARNVIAAALMPAVTALADKFSNFIVDNRKEIADWAKDFADKLPDRISRLGDSLNHIGTAIAPVVHLVEMITEHLGLLQTIVAVVSVTLGAKLLFSILSLASSFLPLVSGFISVVTWGFRIASFLTTLTALLTGLPVWGVVAAVVALGSAIALVYKYWKPMKEFFVGHLPDSIRSALGLDVQHAVVGGTAGGASSGFQLGPALGADGMMSSITQTQVSRQEAFVRLDLGQLPYGSRVSSESNGVPLEVIHGLAGLPK